MAPSTALEGNVTDAQRIDNIMAGCFNLREQDYSFRPLEKARHNKVYLVELNSRTPTELAAISPMPLTHAVPRGTTRLVIRMPKANVSLEDSVRVRNQVVFLHLARQALGAAKSAKSSLAPLIFAWSDGDPEKRWIVEEFKQGEHITAAELESFTHQKQHVIFRQIAEFTKALQDYTLPDEILYGGLTCDDEGKISSTKSSIPCGGPFETYAGFLKGMCTWQRQASERSTHLNGWKDDGELAPRLDRFLASGLDDVLQTVQEDRPTLIHADLGLRNLLFDRETNALAAVVDFDFSHVGAPISEYLFSFYDMNGTLEGSGELVRFPREFLLHGFPEEDDKGDSQDLKMARVLDAAFREVGAKKPSNQPSAGTVADVWWFSQEICEAFWLMDRFLKHRTPAQLAETKDESAKTLKAYLDLWGY